MQVNSLKIKIICLCQSLLWIVCVDIY